MSEVQTRLAEGGATPIRPCGTALLNRILVAEDDGYKARRQSIQQFRRAMRTAKPLRTGTAHIPVVVHVVYNTSLENISQAQIDEQIRVLNEDFNAENKDLEKLRPEWKHLTGNANIRFFLATRDPKGHSTNGVTRQLTSIKAFDNNNIDVDRRMKFKNKGGTDAWPADRYLNLWVCNLGGGLLGYAQFPGGPPKEDGVVIGYTVFGVGGTAKDPFHLGRTTTHEVGHWLDVFHIGGDDGSKVSPDAPDPLAICSGTDHCEDTPNQAEQNYHKPKWPRISCGNGPNGDLFQNFMDYTDDDSMFMFTKDQVLRMDAALTGPRASLMGSDFFEFISQTRTTLPEDSKSVYKFLLADWNKDGAQDLVAIKRNGSGLQVLSGYSNFQTEILQSELPFASSQSAQYDFALADWNSNGHLDLFVVTKSQASTTNSAKKTKIGVYSGKSKFKDILLDTETVLPEIDGSYDLALGRWNDGGKPDLFVIKRSQSDSYAAEVKILSGSSDFKKIILNTSTATLDSTNGTIEFCVTDWNGDGTPDLVAIKKSKTSKSPTEVNVLSGVSGFKDLILKTETALHGTDRNFDFRIADWSGDGRADLVGIKRWDTHSKAVEVHIMAG